MLLVPISSEEKHPAGDYREEHKQIGTLAIDIPIGVDSVYRKRRNGDIQVFGIS